MELVTVVPQELTAGGWADGNAHTNDIVFKTPTSTVACLDFLEDLGCIDYSLGNGSIFIEAYAHELWGH